MDIVSINRILKRYRNQPLVYGELDCNLMFLEIFEPDVFSIIVNRYKTTRGGARVAKKETGFSSIEEYLHASDKYTQKSFNAIKAGDIVIDGLHTAICLGHYTFGIQDGVFKLIQTAAFSHCSVFSKG